MTRTNKHSVEIGKIILCFIFICFIFYPFFNMVSHITQEDIYKVFRSNTFDRALKNSLKIASISTVISVSIGLLLALSLQRTAIKFKSLFYILFTVPMLIPSISHGMGLIILFGTNGTLKSLFHFQNTIYGMKGIITGSVLYSYPVAFLMFNDVLQYQDSTPYEAATVLGISKLRQMLVITFPYLARTFISCIFTVFTMVITDYGVPLMIGGKNTTLAVMMFQQVLGQLDFGKGSVLGLLLLIPAVVTFLINLLYKNRAKDTFVTKEFEIDKARLRDSLAYFFCGFIILFEATLFVSFGIIAFTKKYPTNLSLTLDNFRKMVALRGNSYLTNSLVTAFSVSLIGVMFAFVTAYLTSRMPSKASSALHLFSITSLAIPGLVLGLSYAMTFNTSFIYGTLAIIIMANTVHFFASPYQMMYNSLSKMNENLENIGLTLRIDRIHMIKDVIIPQSKGTLFEMFSYFFVNSMMTISAVSFLGNVHTKPLAMMISQFEGQVLYGCAAVVSLVIFAINVFIKAVVYCINNSKN